MNSKLSLEENKSDYYLQKSLKDKNKFDDAGYNLLRDLSKLHHEKRMHIKVPHVLNKLVTFLKNDGKLPAICFVFSRKKVESFAKMITVPLFHKDEDEPGYWLKYIRVTG